MNFGQFFLFMIFPVSGLLLGYIVMRISERDAKHFDNRKARHSHH